jgi:hypothetical protein
VATIGQLAIQVTADPTGLQAGLGRATNMLGQFAMRTQGLLGGMAGAVAGLLAKVPQTLELLGAKNKLAASLGLDQETLAGLERAAGHLADELPHALRHLQRELGQSFMGDETAQDKFKKWGLDPAALSSGPLKEALGQIADRVKALGSTYAQTAMLTELFGRQGAELLPMFLRGSAGLDAAAAKARELGLALGSADSKKIEGAAKALRDARRTFRGLVNEVTVILAPVIEAITKAFKLVAQGIKGAVDTVRGVLDFFTGRDYAQRIQVKTVVEKKLTGPDAEFAGKAEDARKRLQQEARRADIEKRVAGLPREVGESDADFKKAQERERKKLLDQDRKEHPESAVPVLGPVAQKLKDWQKELDKALTVAREGELAAKIKELHEDADRMGDAKQREKAHREIDEMAKKARENAASIAIDNMRREREKMGLSPEEQKRRDLERMGVSRAKLDEFDREAALTQHRRAEVGLMDFTEGLELNIAAFGKTANETKLLELAMGNARKGIAALTEEELAQAKRLVQELAGKEVQRSVEQPWEEFEREAKKLDELLAAGTLSRQDYDLAITKQLDKFDKAVGGAEAKLSSAATFGSSAAVSAVNQFRVSGAGEDPQQRIQRLWERAAEQRREQIDYARRTVEALDEMAKAQQEEKDQIG